MLSLTRKTDYALMALTYLASRPGVVISAREMSERFGVSLSLLMNVLKQLSGAEMVDSVRGARGGYTLAQPADEITLADLIDTIEGPVRLAPCVGGVDGGGRSGCDASETCPIQGPLGWLHNRLRGFFQNITLAELAAADDMAPVEAVNERAAQR
jgi:Rrf2 family protein